MIQGRRKVKKFSANVMLLRRVVSHSRTVVQNIGVVECVCAKSALRQELWLLRSVQQNNFGLLWDRVFIK
jgi:hypothetical protein